MGYSKSQQEERTMFLEILADESDCDWKKARKAGLLMLRHSLTHARLAEDSCNGPGPNATGPCIDRFMGRVEKREGQIERRLIEIANSIGVTLELGGDPRGFTVKLMTPKTGRYNTWGGAESGWGIPQPTWPG